MEALIEDERCKCGAWRSAGGAHGFGLAFVRASLPGHGHETKLRGPRRQSMNLDIKVEFCCFAASRLAQKAIHAGNRSMSKSEYYRSGIAVREAG